MAWLHPLLGIVAAALLLVVGARGIRSRHRADYAAASRAFHRVWAPRMAVLVVIAAIGGTVSTLALRDDLALTDSAHFWTGWVSAAVLGASWLTSPTRMRGATAKQVHLALGLFVMGVALVGVFLGLGILP